MRPSDWSTKSVNAGEMLRSAWRVSSASVIKMRLQLRLRCEEDKKFPRAFSVDWSAIRAGAVAIL